MDSIGSSFYTQVIASLRMVRGKNTEREVVVHSSGVREFLSYGVDGGSSSSLCLLGRIDG